MICQLVATTADAHPGTNGSWHCHPSEPTQTRRFLAIPKSNGIFQDSRPEPDAIPVTIIRETTTELRCSLPPPLESHQLATTRSTAIATFNDYVLTLPTWEQSLLMYATEEPDATPLYQLLLQKDVSILAVSDGGAFDPYGSFGWV